MYFDLSTPLTLKFMGLGRPLREAERITGFIVTSIIMVLTIMGYRIRVAGNENEPDDAVRRPYVIPGIHTGFTGLEYCGFGSSSRGCPGSTLSPF
jgi:1-acyl-sn-glycerol-3-phosphate acyltransferase